MKTLITFLLASIVSLSSFASVKTTVFQLKAIDNGTVILEECQNGWCTQIGNAKGYNQDDLKFYSAGGKALAIGTGVVEGAVLVVAIPSALALGVIGDVTSGSVSGIKKFGMKALAAGVALSPVIVGGLVLKFVDPINPVSMYKRAEIADKVSVADVDLPIDEVRMIAVEKHPKKAKKLKKNILKVLKKAEI